MAIELGTETSTKQERSAHITRITPARDTPLDAALATALVIQREIARRDGTGKVLSTTPITPPYSFSFMELSASPAVASYVAALGQPSLAAVMQLEAGLYDALIAERKQAAIAAQEAADAAAAQAAADAAAAQAAADAAAAQAAADAAAAEAAAQNP